MKYKLKMVASFFLLIFLCLNNRAQAQAGPDTLMRGFENPPNSAKPRVWWHWMNGNISKEGIQLDLQWMSQVGLGGFTVFEGSIDTPSVVRQRLIYMTPAWKDAFRQAVLTASKLGFEVSIASSPGWSETGGLWVPPAQAMKKMVWSEIRVDGGKPFSGTLPTPPRTTGTFQNYNIQKAADDIPADGKPTPLPQYYADSAVVAYRIPADEETQSKLHPRVTSSGGIANVPALSDGDVDKVALRLPAADPGKQAWVQFEYAKPQRIQSLTLATLDDIARIFSFDDPNAVHPQLEISDDGEKFHQVADISFSSIPQRTISFPAVTARFFRITFPTPSSATKPEERRDHVISELVLSGAARVNEFEKRAGFATVLDYYAIPTPAASPASLVLEKDVIDLTEKMKPDGSLVWTPPPGKWAILRIGYSLTGHQNGPAPAEATGLEVDKLNRQYVQNYVKTYLKAYSDTVGSSMMGKSGIGFLLTDSIEVGAQNWTGNILAEFRKRRGYDPHPWLPSLTGVIIQSPQDTNRFLWDFRRTIAELVAENHYGEIAAELHRHGMGYYSEALEYLRPSLGDDMEMRRYADIPMGAMWTYPSDGAPTPSYIVDLRGAASISHIYGQNLVGAESMTSGGPAWSFAPNNLKMIADLEFALGVNRFMIHESTHQPLVNKAPGLTLGHAGQWFNRNETWAQQAGPWITYLSRTSYMLQQGHFFGDVAYFYGQEGPLTAVYGWQRQQDAPRGYGFDFVNSDVILHQLTVQNGRLVTPGGTSYRILYLGGNSSKITLSVLCRLRDLVAQGAIIDGRRPVSSPSLSDNEAEFYQIADQLWGPERESSVLGHSFGKGKVYSGRTANEVLKDLHVARDFAYTRPETDTKLMFVHRRLSDGDLYFVDNRKDRAEFLDVTFRVQGKAPELWHPDTGRSEPASYRIADGLTTVPLHLDPYETVFVVFRKPATSMLRTLPPTVETITYALQGKWEVRFQPDRGAPEKITLDKLMSWSDNSDPGVKYFSGKATYTKTLQASSDWFKPGSHLWMDLGDVKNIAEVTVNKKSLGIVWKTPYRIDVTKALKPGDNELSIKVTNLWVNRLIGDQQPDSSKKYTFTDIKPYDANSPLLPSGLLGPVTIISATRK